METHTVPARKVRQGDSLPGLDNGYVIDVEENDGYFSYPGGRDSMGAMPEDTVCITFNDADGEECYLILPFGSPVVVER